MNMFRVRPEDCRHPKEAWDLDGRRCCDCGASSDNIQTGRYRNASFAQVARDARVKAELALPAKLLSCGPDTTRMLEFTYNELAAVGYAMGPESPYRLMAERFLAEYGIEPPGIEATPTDRPATPA